MDADRKRPALCEQKNRSIVDGDKQQVYAVFAKHLDRNKLLGYCYSESFDDIEAYYEDRKGYGLEVEAVHPIRIVSGYADRKKELADKRDKLQRQIDELNRQISGIDKSQINQ